MYTDTFIFLYFHKHSPSSVSVFFVTADGSVDGTSVVCLVGIRTRACLTASGAQLSELCRTLTEPHLNRAKPHPWTKNFALFDRRPSPCLHGWRHPHPHGRILHRFPPFPGLGGVPNDRTAPAWVLGLGTAPLLPVLPNFLSKRKDFNFISSFLLFWSISGPGSDFGPVALKGLVHEMNWSFVDTHTR